MFQDDMRSTSSGHLPSYTIEGDQVHDIDLQQPYRINNPNVDYNKPVSEQGFIKILAVLREDHSSPAVYLGRRIVIFCAIIYIAVMSRMI